MYEVLYRKWRPKTFADVYGQEQIVSTLKNEIKNNRYSHAYLFTGSRGTGKTTCARILAKAINCLNPHDGDACGECEICRGIENGSILDITEIDAASNNGVDDIRNLRDEVNYTPVTTKFRVYIIDEVHMLSASAFNALLKTLEEPPAHVVFVLATTEVHKLMATILSRCQRFDFGRISADSIAARLKYVVKQEAFSVDDGAIQLIARLAEGGMRDALSILDRCVAAESNVTVDSVVKTTGLLSNAELFELSRAVAQNDAARMFEVVERLNSGFGDTARVCDQIIVHFRNLMVAKTVKDPRELIICSESDLNGYMNTASAFSLGRILKGLSALQTALENIKSGRNGRVEIEMALLSICNIVDQDVQKMPVTQEKETVNEKEMITSADNVTQKDCEELDEHLYVEEELPETKTGPRQTDETTKNTVVESAELPKQPENLAPREKIEKSDAPFSRFSRWAEVVKELSKKNPLMAAVLRISEAFVDGDLILIKCTDSDFTKLMREGTKNRTDIRNAIKTVTGMDYRLGPYREKEIEEVKDPLVIFEQNVKNRK